MVCSKLEVITKKISLQQSAWPLLREGFWNVLVISKWLTQKEVWLEVLQLSDSSRSFLILQAPFCFCPLGFANLSWFCLSKQRKQAKIPSLGSPCLIKSKSWATTSQCKLPGSWPPEFASLIFTCKEQAQNGHLPLLRTEPCGDQPCVRVTLMISQSVRFSTYFSIKSLVFSFLMCSFILFMFLYRAQKKTAVTLWTSHFQTPSSVIQYTLVEKSSELLRL